MIPKQIKIFEKSKLMVSWPDGSVYKIALQYLRDECPCAGCKGETVLLKTYRPAKKTNDNPLMYKIKDIQIVGGYGIQITWKDGHNTGIYTWQYLNELNAGQDKNTKQGYNDLL